MLQQDQPDDYVVATNEMHSVRSFIEKSFSYVDIKVEWEGEALTKWVEIAKQRHYRSNG